MEDRGRPIAIFSMDPWAQVDKLVLLPDVSQKDTLSPLQVTASHAVRYVVRRQYAQGILIAKHHGIASRTRSAELLLDGNIPDDIATLDAEKLTEMLREIGVDVIKATVYSLEEAIESALSDERLTVPISFEAGTQNGIFGEKRVTFRVKAPAQFRIWKNVGKSDLYIVPAYHPEQDSNRHQVNLINGDTDALIGGQAVRYIYAPSESTEGQERGFRSSSWSGVNHPFYAAGSEITLQVSTTKALSAEGIEEIVTLMAAALELKNTHLSVSGGFRGTYTDPENIARRSGIRTSSWNGKARGSEGFCVWAYQVLKNEGELDRAYIPRWFNEEGWLSAYESAGYLG